MNLNNTLTKKLACILVLSMAVTVGATAQALTVPFTEDFSADVADWANAGSFPLTYVANGGPDGSGYASTQFSFASGGGAGGSDAVLFRGHDEFGASGSSGGAFVGNWVSEGVTELTAKVRHNAPVPLSYFVRASGPFNFPGATAVQFVPVLPNTWTEISFDVSVDSNQLVTFEGTDHSTVFSNIGHLQFGVTIPDGFDMNPTSFTFDLDQVSIVPEPSTLMLSSLAMLAVFSRRRTQR